MLLLYLTAIDSESLCRLNTNLGNVIFQIAFQHCICHKYNIQPNYFYMMEYLKMITRLGINYNKTIFRNFSNIYSANVTTDISLEENSKGMIYSESLVHDIVKHKEQNILIKNSYLQSILYFHEYENDIQELFSPDSVSLTHIYQKYPSIKNTDNNVINISIHIRLEWSGSLALNPIKYKVDYYKDSITFFQNKYQDENVDIKYWVFSDNINESKMILSQLDLEYIFCENNYDYIDLWIMSLCHHNIICHSTFGWWGAYLNRHKNKNVLYPSDVTSRFCKNILHIRDEDRVNINFFPESWIQIKSHSMINV